MNPKVLFMLFQNCKKVFLLLAVTTGEILPTTLHSYLKIVHRKNISLVSNESESFPYNILHFQLNYHV